MERRHAKAYRELNNAIAQASVNIPDGLTRESDTITLKRIYSTHCQVCGTPHEPIAIVFFVKDDNNLCCYDCAHDSYLEYEPRIYKEDK